MAKQQVLKCDMVSVESLPILLTSGLISVAGAFNSGTIRKVQQTYGLVHDDAIEGETAVLFTRAPRAVVPKTTGAAMSKGDIMWLDTSALTVSSTDGGSDVDVGMVYEDALSAADEVVGSFRGF